MKFIHLIDNQHLGMKKRPKGKRILKVDLLGEHQSFAPLLQVLYNSRY